FDVNDVRHNQTLYMPRDEFRMDLRRRQRVSQKLFSRHPRVVRCFCCTLCDRGSARPMAGDSEAFGEFNAQEMTLYRPNRPDTTPQQSNTTMRAIKIAFFIGLTATANFSAWAAENDPVKKDMAQLQGEWSMVSGSADGQPMP